MPNQKPTPNQKPITNPELVEALKALHQENTPQNQGKVLGLVVEPRSWGWWWSGPSF